MARKLRKQRTAYTYITTHKHFRQCMKQKIKHRKQTKRDFISTVGNHKHQKLTLNCETEIQDKLFEKLLCNCNGREGLENMP